jgi:FKBP-type peptidyl-prolyl cis-trans isomerase FkpA
MTRAAFASLLAPLVCLGCQPGSTPPSPKAAPSPLAQTEEQKTFYTLGLLVGRNLTNMKLSATELESVKRGISDAATGHKPDVAIEVYGPKVQELLTARAAAGAEAEKTKAAAFREAASKEQGAVTTTTGLIFRTLRPGNGPSPTVKDTVKVNYEGKLVDGTVFDSSLGPNREPAVFPLKGVIPCWTEGVQKMKVGEKAKFTCPSELAYGDRGQPPTIPGGATLIFEVDLLAIQK